MTPREPLPLYHSWPLAEMDQRFDLGLLHPEAGLPHELSMSGAGTWCCDLANSRLAWSDEVHHLFGLPLGRMPAREDTIRIYEDTSRSAMERLRTHAIRHRRGFTIDVMLDPPGRKRRWMRLIASPIVIADRVTHLHGLKRDVTVLYR